MLEQSAKFNTHGHLIFRLLPHGGQGRMHL